MAMQYIPAKLQLNTETETTDASSEWVPKHKLIDF
jgi:hypothetical protein